MVMDVIIRLPRIWHRAEIVLTFLLDLIEGCFGVIGALGYVVSGCARNDEQKNQ